MGGISLHSRGHRRPRRAKRRDGSHPNADLGKSAFADRRRHRRRRYHRHGHGCRYRFDARRPRRGCGAPPGAKARHRRRQQVRQREPRTAGLRLLRPRTRRPDTDQRLPQRRRRRSDEQGGRVLPDRTRHAGDSKPISRSPSSDAPTPASRCCSTPSSATSAP